MPLTVTDNSTNKPSKLGSALIPKDVFGEGAARFLAVQNGVGVLEGVDLATGTAVAIDPSKTYPIFNGALVISDAV